MSVADKAALVAVFEGFKVRFAAMVDAYNAQVNAAVKAGTPLPDADAFSALLNQLVQDTRARLKLALTADGMGRFDAHIQSEKSGMSIPAPVGAQ